MINKVSLFLLGAALVSYAADRPAFGTLFLFFLLLRYLKRKKSAKDPVGGILQYTTLYDLDELPDEFVVLDLETTGLDCEQDRIVEVGVVRYRKEEILEEYSMLFKPGRSIPPEATRIHGISDAMVKGKPKFRRHAQRIAQMLDGEVVLGYNIRFDMDFLDHEFKKAGVSLDQVDLFDVYRLARKSIPKGKVRNYKLDTVKRYFSIDLPGHRAINDCRATQQVLMKCRTIHRNRQAERTAKQAELRAKLSEDERLFIATLEKEMDQVGLKKSLSYEVKSDRTILFKIDDLQIGRLKLNGRKRNMQILSKSPEDVVWIEDIGINEALGNIHCLVEYAGYLAG